MLFFYVCVVFELVVVLCCVRVCVFCFCVLFVRVCLLCVFKLLASFMCACGCVKASSVLFVCALLFFACGFCFPCLLVCVSLNLCFGSCARKANKLHVYVMYPER